MSDRWLAYSGTLDWDAGEFADWYVDPTVEIDPYVPAGPSQWGRP